MIHAMDQGTQSKEGGMDASDGSGNNRRNNGSESNRRSDGSVSNQRSDGSERNNRSDGSGTNRRSDGSGSNRRNNVCYKQSIGEKSMDQGAIDLAMDVTSGETEGAMDQGAND